MKLEDLLRQKPLSEDVKDRIVREMEGVIWHFVGKVYRRLPRWSSDDRNDLYQEATMIVLRLAEKYHPDGTPDGRTAKFSTFVWACMERSLRYTAYRRGGMIRVPVSQARGRHKTEKDAADTHRALSASAFPVYEDGSIYEPLDAASIEEETVDPEEADAQRWALARLSPRLRKVLSLRYGLEDGQELTTQQISERAGIRRQRVKRLFKPAMRNLRALTAYRLRKPRLKVMA